MDPKDHYVNCGPRGGTGGAKPGSGVQRFWGPLGASEFDPRFSNSGSQRPLGAPERLSGPRARHFRGLGEGCPFSTERENKVGHSEASKRPRFPGCPLRGFQPSGSYPQATDNYGTERLVPGCSVLLGTGCRSCETATQLVAVSFPCRTCNSSWSACHWSDYPPSTSASGSYYASWAAQRGSPR